MIEVTDAEFEAMVATGIDAIPERFAVKLDNVAITWQDTPDWWQRAKMRLPPWQSLFGLYEGIPKTRRGSNYSLVLPDKITIFRQPLAYVARNSDQLAALVKKTVWHEVGHHFGLSDAEIHALEDKQTA
ncbi:MAG TPA: metallopeptidase family protein [Candidatus Saccharimonadales bacterium]